MRWAEYLSRFNFKIVYRPGKQGTKPDTLTRRSVDVPQDGDPRLECQKQTIIKPEHLSIAPIEVQIPTTQRWLEDLLPELSAASPEPPASDSGSEATTINKDTPTLDDLIDQAYAADLFPNEVLRMLQEGVTYSKKISLADCEDRDGKLYYRGKIFVPDLQALKLRLY